MTRPCSTGSAPAERSGPAGGSPYAPLVTPGRRPRRLRLAALAALAALAGGPLLLLGGTAQAAVAMPGQGSLASRDPGVGAAGSVGLAVGEAAVPVAAGRPARVPSSGHPPRAASTTSSSGLTRLAFLVVGGAVLLGLAGLLGLYLTRGAARKGRG